MGLDNHLPQPASQGTAALRVRTGTSRLEFCECQVSDVRRPLDSVASCCENGPIHRGINILVLCSKRRASTVQPGVKRREGLSGHMRFFSSLRVPWRIWQQTARPLCLLLY